MSLVKKAIKPLEFELFIKVYCPHCAASDKGKEIGIMLPARSRPEVIKCFNCSGVISLTGILTSGKEKIVRADKGEKIL